MPCLLSESDSLPCYVHRFATRDADIEKNKGDVRLFHEIKLINVFKYDYVCPTFLSKKLGKERRTWGKRNK